MATPLPPALGALEARLGLDDGDLEGAEKARAAAAIDDATALVLAEVSDTTAAKWATDAPAVVVLVVLKAARREYDNPTGLAQEALGEHSASGMDTSGVFLTAREVALVQRAEVGRRGKRVGSLRLSSYGDPE